MSLIKTTDAYLPIQKTLHWVVVVLIALQFLVFDDIGRAFHRLVDTGVATYSVSVIAHIAIGAAVFAFAVWRIVLKLRHGAPAAPEAEPPALRTLSKLAHLAFYALMLFLPFSGGMAWFLGNETPAEVHEAVSNLLLLLIAVHVAAVVVHQAYWKTNLLARMR